MGSQSEKKRKRTALLKRDGENCGICGGPLNGDHSIDHILAKRNGGSNRLENLQLSHTACNQRKNRMIDGRFFKQVNNRAKAQNQKGENMKLELGILVGAESKEWLADLTKQIDRLEKLQGATTTKKAATTAAETETEEKTTISAKTVKAQAAKKTAKAPATEEEQFDLGEETETTDEAPAITKADLIAACRENREGAIKVLKKMKVSSVHEVKPAQYATVLQQIGAN